MKDTFYFSHDYNARNDPKMQKLLMNYGQEGKGIYWDLIEMLYEQDGYLLLSECETYAFQLRTTYDRITEVIRNSELFNTDEKRFWSESVLRRLNERKKKSDSARQSVMKRWNDTNVIRTKCDRNTIKERKGKEIKRNIVKKKFIPPDIDEVRTYFIANGYRPEVAEKAFMYYNSANWHDSKGSPVINWKQKMIQVWFKPEHQIIPVEKTIIPQFFSGPGR